MSWSVPTQQGQWPPGVAMTPDMMNVGSAAAGYTPEQWAAMQQNWQQWAQWQQQYAQWQNQYGEKYAAQMQTMQMVAGGVPAPPSSAPPAAPPPPANPPPPYENDAPLYASARPAPVPAPADNNTNLNQHVAGNPRAEPTPTINADALKKLAEEEKLFDIQFQKWEEEIEKWRKENVNHPDRAAYEEYEQKFETCRAQLLERRQQMKQKRARLMSNAPNAAGTPVSGKIPPAVPPPLRTPGQYDQGRPQGYDQSRGYDQNQQYNQSQNYNQSQSNNFNQTQNYNTRQDYRSQQNFDKRRDQNYSNPNASSYQQYSDSPSSSFDRGNRGSIDPQDRYESYDNAANNYTADDNYASNESYPPEKPSFLPTSGAPKSIPGLDLVPDTDKAAPVQQQDVIDITEDNTERNQSQIGPDYTTISKGINNILGDEKIMNILSMVRGNTPAGNTTPNNSAPNTQYPPPSMGHNGPPPGMGHSGPPPNMGHNGPPPNMGHNGPRPGMGHNGPPPRMGHNGPPPGMGHNGPPPRMGFNGPPPSTGHNNQNMPANNQWNRNDGYNNQQQQQYGNRQNYPNQNQDQNRFPPNQRQMFDERQGSGGQDMYYDRNSQFGGPNMPQRNDQGPRQNAPGPKPLMDLHIPPNIDNDFSRGPPNRGMPPNMAPPNPPPPPPRPKWMDEVLFTPSLVVEYEHKPLRLKAREFIEPVHMFDYDHKSKDGDNKRKDFEKEADELFSRKPRRDRDDQRAPDRYDMPDRQRDREGRDFERRVPREDMRDDFRRRPPREEFDDRRRPDDRFDDRRRDDRDRDRFSRREDIFRDRERERDRDRERERERDRDVHRDRFNREQRRDEPRIRSRSRDRDSRKRGLSKDRSEPTDVPKKSRETNSAEKGVENAKHVVMIDDILEAPGREMRPDKIVIILRGPPGSGKSYLAKLIRDREAEYGGAARIMSIDDYFMQEGEVEEKDPTTGKIVKKPTLKYEYDENLEESYLNSLKRAFKRSLTDGYFTFLIYDAVNDHLRSYADVWNFARQNGFQVYVCTMELDAQLCHKRNIHNRTLSDIQVIVSRFFPTPPHHIQLDATTLLQSASIPEVHMEDADDAVVMEDAQDEVETSFTSKWEKMDDAAQLAKLDGTNKPLRSSQLSMEDYLQLDDWTPNKAKPGKKSVRWADIEERRQQEKMRAIGFVVGQTDWNRMTDPTMGSSALTQTKYIERVRRT